jgi:hypothetical protein
LEKYQQMEDAMLSTMQKIPQQGISGDWMIYPNATVRSDPITLPVK